MSLIATIGASAKPPAAGGDPSAVVSGAGTGAANGDYPYTEQFNDKGKYNLTATIYIYWVPNFLTGAWVVNDEDTDVLYYGEENVAFPWLVLSWFAASGSEPAPTVSQG